MVDTRKKLDVRRSLFSYVLILMAFIGVGVLFINDVKAGKVFFILTVLGAVALQILYIYIKEHSPEEDLEHPIADSLLQATFFFFFGVSIPLLFNLFSPMKLHNIIKPFFIFSSSPETVNGMFHVVSISLDSFWEVFLSVITAGVLEPIIFGYFAIVIGFVVGKYLIKLIPTLKNNIDEKLGGYIFAFIFSIILFVVAHKLNSSYAGIMFLWAAIFALIRCLALYWVNVPLSFWQGLHMSNNATAIGWNLVFSALFSSKGFILLIFFGLNLIYLFWNLKRIPEVVKAIKPGL